jgi:hypothetical protein
MTQSKSKRMAEARKHLAIATRQWDEASTAWWPPPDAAECVTKCFYALENAVVAAAIALEMPWKKQHPDKAKIAADLAKQSKVSADISDRLHELNDLRKDVSYDEPGPELAAVDLEDLLGDVESYLEEVRHILDDVEGL